jgi:hypothetical protein
MKDPGWIRVVLPPSPCTMAAREEEARSALPTPARSAPTHQLPRDPGAIVSPVARSRVDIAMYGSDLRCT